MTDLDAARLRLRYLETEAKRLGWDRGREHRQRAKELRNAIKSHESNTRTDR